MPLMNELAFKFGQNSITYEYGRRFVTINGEKHRAGKYYYLNVLESISDYPSLNNQMLSWIMNIYNATNAVYNPDVIRYVSDIQRCMTVPELAGIDAFLTVIYLAMFDLETSKSFPNSLGKDMVLRSCQAVLLKQKTAKEAAVMFEKKKVTSNDSCFDNNTECYNEWDDYGTSGEKYGYYNGYSDDVIDDAFDGCPEATWNVD